ncbi:MAG: nuclear transport factor 2 family protein [Hyphomonadaceae bacterium]
MSVAQNKQTALRFLQSMADGAIDAALLHPQAMFWTFRMGDTPRDKFLAMMEGAKKMAPNGMKMHIRTATAEEDRVSVEAKGECTLANGFQYDNTYHFLFEVRDGKIFRMREYNDPRLATAALGEAG